MGGFLAALAPATISTIAGLVGGKNSTPNSTINPLMTGLGTNAGFNQQQGKDLYGFGSRQLQAGTGNMAQGANYFQTLLNGNRSAVTQTLAPQIQQTQQQFQRALTTGSQLTPRGGGRASTLFDLPGQATSILLGMYDQARPQAAGMLPQIGSMQAGVGGGVVGQGINATNSSSSAFEDAIRNALGISNIQNNNAAGISKGVANLLQPIDWTKIFGGGLTNAGKGQAPLIPVATGSGSGGWAGGF